jgi:hypothetical protein
MALPLGFNVLGGPFDDPWSGPASVRVLPWRLDPVDGRSLPDGEYALDLASSTLTLVRETPRGASSKRLIQEAWPARPVGAAMVLQSGRRSLHLGLDGSGEEVAGHVDRWLLAPDGTRLLMVTARSQLVVYEFATQRSWVLGGPTEYGAVEWSPTGQHISATIFEPFGDSWTTVVFDAMRLDDLVSQPLDYWAPDDQPLLLIEETWSWRWRGSTELFVGADGGLSLLDVETGSLRSIRLDRQPYDTLAWDATTSTLAHSRVRGVPVSVIDLDNGGAWFDIPLLAASPQLGLFDMTGAPRDSGSR